ncbi:hypothetical protein DFH07DRAFT_124312 [Mycena maculata]|uniref:SWIM-type domain-containing protein n=1 Tax=Mycena maculata TaxID=230809 RepID=A0AAD7JYB8_9AGAR|nr:hypothetical protein DFH07DRAFT_124312 [Mycena maculata]
MFALWDRVAALWWDVPEPTSASGDIGINVVENAPASAVGVHPTTAPAAKGGIKLAIPPPTPICWWGLDSKRDTEAKGLVDKKSFHDIRCSGGDFWRATCAGRRYDLYLHRQGYASCSCPDFEHRSGEKGACKHLRALRMIIESLGGRSGHPIVSSFYYPGTSEAAHACSIPSGQEMDSEVVATVDITANTPFLVTKLPHGTYSFPERLPEFASCSHRIDEVQWYYYLYFDSNHN